MTPSDRLLTLLRAIDERDRGVIERARRVAKVRMPPTVARNVRCARVGCRRSPDSSSQRRDATVMGFLSKLFGGDAEPAPAKAADDAGASSAADAPTSTKSVAPTSSEASDAPATLPLPAAPAAARAERVTPDPPLRAAPGAGQRRSVPRRATERLDGMPAAPLTREPAPETPRAAPAVPRERQPSVSQDVTLASPAARRPPEAPRRSAALEASVITSAPPLTSEPVRPVPAPRPPPGVRSRVSGAEPATPKGPAAADAPLPPARAPMSSVSEAGLLTGRTRKDRTKSPGFYSNMAPAYGSQVVSPSLGQGGLKRTMVGVAPPPDRTQAAEALAKVSAEADAVKARGDTNGAASAIAAPSEADEPGASAGGERSTAGDGAVRALAADDVASAGAAPPRAVTDEAPDELEKEETAPGVGHMPSRHDPALRHEIPDRDLDLLVQFGMDVGLGLATEAWLAPARGAVARLQAAAARVQRGALDKALAQLAVELEAPNALAEERKGRIVQALVLVDLALPRPVDISGQRLVCERLIVQHLLAELSASHPLIAQRLRDEGGISLERFGRIDSAELADKVGLSVEQVEQGLTSFRDYLQERMRRGPEAALLGKAPLLAQKLAELEASAESFEQVADGDDARAKREARRRRQTDISRVSLFLAEWGEAAILGELERSSVQGKIARLRRWLTELTAS